MNKEQNQVVCVVCHQCDGSGYDYCWGEGPNECGECNGKGTIEKINDSICPCPKCFKCDCGDPKCVNNEDGVCSCGIPTKVKICYVYYDTGDFTSSCDPIRVDLIVDGICIKSQSTHQYMEYREVVEGMVEYCKTAYKDSRIEHVCAQDCNEDYKFGDVSTEGNKGE